MHGTIVVVGDYHHNNRSYTIQTTMTGHIVTRSSKHLSIAPVTAEQYFRDQLTWHTDDPIEYLNIMKHSPQIRCKAILA